MECTISMQVKVCIPDDKTVPIESPVYDLKNQRTEAGILEQILVSMDNHPVKFLCGRK